jgi:hypothetical protein
MESYERQFETCPTQCDYSVLKARIYFLEKENVKLKSEVARLVIDNLDKEHTESEGK